MDALDKRLSCYIVVDMFLSPGVFLTISTLLIKISALNALTLRKHHPNSDSKFWFPIMCSDTDRTVGDVNCFVCTFFSHVIWMWRHESWWKWECCTIQSVQIDVSWLLQVNLIFKCIIHLMVRILDSILNP